MGMPSGDSPQKAQQIVHYLQGHDQTYYRAATWQVRWLDLAWLWGFLAALLVVLVFWILQYRSTRQRIYSVDTFGGVTTEMARPATLFFILLAVGLAAFAVVLIVGHIVWGQKF